MFNLPFLRKAADVFGLDIGSSTVKVVQLNGSGKSSLPMTLASHELLETI